MSNLIQTCAERLDSAYLNAKDILRLTKDFPDLTMSDANAIQKLIVEARLRRGDVICGMKMGLTSKAKMNQMGVKFPIVGVLTDRMQIPTGGTLEHKKMIHPKVEQEIAFITRTPISRVLTRRDALQHCSHVCAAAEIIDSRYINFDFTLPDVIADNCSSSHFVLGPLQSTDLMNEATLDNLGMVMSINGEAVQFGSSNAILGHVLDSVVELSKICADRASPLPAGSIILAGSSTAAVTVERGDRFEIEVQKLGTVSASFI